MLESKLLNKLNIFLTFWAFLKMTLADNLAVRIDFQAKFGLD